MNLSIIIPAYNSSKYIENCVNSINNKNKDSLEIIIINDGSTDNTQLICENLCKKYDNIKLINKNNEGVSVSRNIGISKATGKYIMFVDSDDELLPEWYEIVFNNLNSKCDINYFSEQIPKEDVNISSMLSYISGNNTYHFDYAGPVSKVFKTSFLKNNNIIFDKNLSNGEDMIFNFEALLQSNNYNIVRQSFYKYRNYGGSSTKKFDENIFETDKNFQNKIEKIINKFNISQSKKKEILNYYSLNGILTVFIRMSYLDKFEDFYKRVDFLNQEPYLEVKNKIKFPISFDFRKKLLIILIKNKHYRLVYKILKLYFKNNYGDKEIFILI